MIMRKFRLLAIFLGLFTGALFLSQLDVQDGFSLTPDWFSKRDRLARLDTLNRVLYHIQESYVDPERVKPQEMFEKALDNISQAVAEVRVLRPSPKKAILVVDQKRKEFDTNLTTAFALRSSLSDALKFVRSHKRSDITDEDLENTAINGVLSTLDPHSIYLNKELFKEMTAVNIGVFGGLGIEIGVRETKLTVIRPLENTPASRAGLQAGDVVTRIGEDSTRNMSLNEAVDRLRGLQGTKVTITLARKEWDKDKDVTLTRARINVVSVDSHLLPGEIGYVRIKNFQKNTSRDLNRQLAALHRKAGGELKGLVLDLRNDPGGLLDQSIAVTDKFLEKGVIVSTVDMNAKARNEERATRRGTEPNYPMVVLVNGASASASEIVAGALQRQGRAILLGERTFGKGTVQSIFEFPGKSALKLTVAKYFTPGNISIQSVGISPEIRTVPATISSERTNLFPNQSRLSEKSLKHHFDNPEKAEKALKPIVALRYYEPRTISEIVKDETRLTALRKEPKVYVKGLLKNVLIELASDIVTTTTSPSRTDLLLAAKASAHRVEQRENGKIAKALSERNIDWKSIPTTKQTNCGVPKASFQVNGNKKRTVVAGETVKLALTLQNSGPCTLYQAWGNASAKSYFLNDREFLFGTVPPHASVTRNVEVEIPLFIPSSLVSLRFEFKEAQNIVPEEFTKTMTIQAAPTPEFAFNYQVRDISKTGANSDRNGLIEPGEAVELWVEIQNKGSAESKEGVATIRQEGTKTLTFRRTHIPLPALKPGKKATATFLIEVPSSFREDSFELDLTIADVKYRLFLSKKLPLQVFPHRKELTQPQTAIIKEGRVPIYLSPALDAPIIAQASQDATLPTKRSFGKFLHVELPNQGMGWIKKSEVTLTRLSKTKKPTGEIQPVVFQPPKVTSDLGKRIFRSLDGQFLHLTGSISGSDPIKDLLVFVNQKKVFYQNYEDPSLKGPTQSFKTSIPLEPGTNRVLLLARDQNDLMQREAVVLHRTGEEPDTDDEERAAMDEFLFSPNY